MAFRWWHSLLGLFLVATPVALWAYDRSQGTTWVGSTDLEVTFAVTDAGTGSPVEGALVEVTPSGWQVWPEGGEALPRADRAGAARRVWRRVVCFGGRSGLGLREGAFVWLPACAFQVSAPGYETAGWHELDTPGHRRQVRGAQTALARLVVRASLHRKPG